MRKFQDLEMWKQSHKLTLDIYETTRNQFPKEELFALTTQIRRASASIPTNIAEGCGRKTNQELVRFLHIASGSTTEVEYQLLLAKDPQYINSIKYKELSSKTIEIRKMILSFIKNIPQNNSVTYAPLLKIPKRGTHASSLEPGA
ncbi:MAG: four helix bundle protein [Fibrobacter sp.]|nr:four helix bundle protein [Fibrobacter sp.]